MERNRTLIIKMNDEEFASVKELANSKGVTKSVLIRDMVKNAHRRIKQQSNK